jgi:hypothetical protein
MAVEWNRGAAAQHEPLIADRHLYLDKTGNTVVEEGDANSASQLVAAGHPIDPADAGRLGLVLKDGRVVQDRAAKIEEHQRLVDELQGEKDALYASIDQYRAENASKDIPNTMEAARVALETRYEHAKLALSQFIKAHAGKDPLKGESQATALEPEESDVANEATARANAAVSASPTPAQLAANSPKEKGEVAPQHPDTAPSENASNASSEPASEQGHG